MAPAMARGVAASAKPSVMPGFGLTLGFTLTYLGLIVLIPLAGAGPEGRAASAWTAFWRIATDAAGAGGAASSASALSLLAALVNARLRR